MRVRQPMGPDELRRIKEEARQVSVKKGLVSEEVKKPAQPQGAYASMQRRVQQTPVPGDIQEFFSFPSSTQSPETGVRDTRTIVEDSHSQVKPGMLYSRIYESIETVGQTREYFNATSSLFTLYALGQLTEGVLRTLGTEDLKEIKGILRDFQRTLES